VFSKIELVSRWIVILTMCHVSEFQKILDFNYTRIGLSIYVKLSLGKWLGTRQKIIQNRSQKTQNHASSFRVRDQKYYHRIGILLQFETSALPTSINDIHIIIACSPISVCNILNLANWFFSCIQFSAAFLSADFEENSYCHVPCMYHLSVSSD